MASRLVKEEIDTRILNLLGIDDVFDIDYTTYLLLLREAMVKGSFGKSKLSDEELALLSNERKRVKNKQDSGQVTLLFDHTSTDLEQVIQSIGALPLPPYIAGKREPDKHDEIDYQTYFATEPGAVAAPTAGLHFTKELINKLLQSNIKIFSVTLHVGAGTFLPVKVENTNDHVMHKEYAYLDKDTAKQLNEIKRNQGRIVAVGTTALRVLESASNEIGHIQPYSDFTDIFITPGYKFKFTDLLLTNFHLPKSTLFMLVSAFAGLENMKQAYKYAIDNNYRFYSYGDACLLSREIR